MPLTTVAPPMAMLASSPRELYASRAAVGPHTDSVPSAPVYSPEETMLATYGAMSSSVRTSAAKLEQPARGTRLPSCDGSRRLLPRGMGRDSAQKSTSGRPIMASTPKTHRQLPVSPSTTPPNT